MTHPNGGQASAPGPPEKTVLYYPVGTEKQRPYRTRHHRASLRGMMIARSETMTGGLGTRTATRTNPAGEVIA